MRLRRCMAGGMVAHRTRSAIVPADADRRARRAPARHGGGAWLAGLHARLVVSRLEPRRRRSLLRSGPAASCRPPALSPTNPEAHEVYRYAPWFAVLWIPL